MMDAIVRNVTAFVGAIRGAVIHGAVHHGDAEEPSPRGVSVPHSPQPGGSSRCVVGVLPGAFQGSVQDRIAAHGGRVKVLRPQDGSPQQLMEGVDALAICGGRDVDPRFYGEPMNGSEGIHEAGTREDAFMIACIQEGYKRGTPMLGMCRGHQLMNVADGGSLYQDFPTQQAGTARHGYGDHVVTLDADSQIASVIGATRWATNTIHHQAVKVPGAHMRVSGRTSDGVVEAIEKRDNPTQIGTQFHPEIMSDKRSQRLFGFLVESGAQFRAQRQAIAAIA